MAIKKKKETTTAKANSEYFLLRLFLLLLILIFIESNKLDFLSRELEYFLIPSSQFGFQNIWPRICSKQSNISAMQWHFVNQIWSISNFQLEPNFKLLASLVSFHFKLGKMSLYLFDIKTEIWGWSFQKLGFLLLFCKCHTVI